MLLEYQNVKPSYQSHKLDFDNLLGISLEQQYLLVRLFTLLKLIKNNIVVKWGNQHSCETPDIDIICLRKWLTHKIKKAFIKYVLMRLPTQHFPGHVRIQPDSIITQNRAQGILLIKSHSRNSF